MLLPPSCPYVFSNFRGDHLTDLTAVVTKNGFSLPTCRAVRSAVEVQAMCRPPAEKQAITHSLSHSTDTAEKHYREGLSIRLRLYWRTGV